MTASDFERARQLSTTNKDAAIDLYKQIVDSNNTIVDEEIVKVKEQSILQLAQLYSSTGRAQDLEGLIRGIHPFLNMISKAKASKLVRLLVDLFLDMEASTGLEVKICKDWIEWAKTEKRTFLRQSLEARLIALYYETKQYNEALLLGSTLLKELKKMDEKNLLIEVQLLESKTYHALSNLPKARAALTSARTTANSIYCPPKMQAALDLQSGILHAADERDFKTAFSYFYEAFEGFDSVDSPKAITALKYMMLSKIMLKQPEDVQSLTMGKVVSSWLTKHAGNDINAMKAVAKASHKRSLHDFQVALSEYQKELYDDPIIKAHLDTVYDNMLEQNLCRIIEPYSKVQVDHIAKLINLSRITVETKLSQMILDKKFSGILDQGEAVLIIFEDETSDKTYEAALDLIQNMSKVVDTLYQKAKKLS